MLNLIQSIMQNIYGSNTGYSTKSGQTYSLTSQGFTQNRFNSAESSYSQFETAEMYAFVRNYHLTQAILTMLQSFVSDLYRDASLRVTIPSNSEWEEYANNILEAVDVKKNIIEDLSDYLYEGNQGKYYDSLTESLKPLANPTDFQVYYENDIPKMAMVQSVRGRGVRPVRYYNGLWLQFKPYTTKAFSYDVDTEKNHDADLFYDNEFKQGQSIFRGAILKLYSMFIKEYLADQMALKEALKNEVLVANVGDENTDQKDISEATEMISNLVNDEESMSILSHSPEALLRLIDEKMVNYVNVVPGIQNFTNFDKLDVFSLRDKLGMLRDDIEADEDRVYKTLGISKELMNGDSTKYEAMERSSRFVTLISYINSSLISSLQKFVCAQIFRKYGIHPSEAQVQFNIDSTALLTNVDTAYKFRILQDTMQAVNDAANSYSDLARNENVDAEQAYSFFTKKLSGIDASLVDLIKKVQPEDESGDGSGNENSEW